MGIVHRDVKPENILYTLGPNRNLLFKLGDFGLCNQSAVAQSTAGTPLYMAPEIFSGRQGQTPKADIWSLFIVLLWIYDFKGFRNAHLNNFTIQLQQQLVRDATAPAERLGQLKEMARLNPEKRASAAQMMLKLGLFAKEPRAILCSHGKDPRRIPEMPKDDPPPVSRGSEKPVGKKPVGKKSTVSRPASSDVEMTGVSSSYVGRAVRKVV